MFRLVWLRIEGTGLAGFDSIYQGHLFFQKDTYVPEVLSFSVCQGRILPELALKGFDAVQIPPAHISPQGRIEKTKGYPLKKDVPIDLWRLVLLNSGGGTHVNLSRIDRADRFLDPEPQ